MNRLYFTLITTLIILVTGCGVVGAQRLEPGWGAVKIDYANNGARTDIPSGGFLQYNPLTERIAEYPIGQESLVMVKKAGEGQAASAAGDDSVECRDQHGIPVHIDTTLFWRIDPQKIGDMFVLRPNVPLIGKTLNDGIDGVVVRRLVRGTMQDTCAPLLYNDIFGPHRAEYVNAVAQSLGCPTTPLAATTATSTLTQATGQAAPTAVPTTSPLNTTDPLKRTADPTTALGKEFIICDKFQMGEIYLDDAQAKAFSEQASAQQAAITAQAQVEQKKQEALAAVEVAQGLANAVKAKADGDAYQVRTAADALAYDIATRQKALAAAPEVRTYDVQMAAANHPSMVTGAATQVQVPLPAGR